MIACELHAKPEWTTGDCRDCYVCRLQAVNRSLLAACETAFPIVEAAGCGGWIPEPEVEKQLREAIDEARGES